MLTLDRESRRELAFMVLIGCIFAVQLFGSVFSNKIAIVAGVTFSMGAVTASIGLGLLDVLNDLRGRVQARRVAGAVLLVRVFVYVILVPLILLFPTKSEPTGFSDILGSSQRLFVAGLASYGVSVWIVNVSLFSWLKERMKGRWFVLRYVAVTIPVLFISSVVNTFVGFWGTDKDLWALIFGAMTVRYAATAVLAPLTGGLRWAMRRL